MVLRQLGMVAVLLAGAFAQPARSAVLVPMTDADLVALSDLVVVGTVAEVRSVRLDGPRVVTRVTIALEDVVKGDPSAPAVVVTEIGGRVGRVAMVVPDGPEYVTGERVVAFLRQRADGSLRTTGMGLGVYHVSEQPPAAAMARRATPAPDPRAFERFTAHLRSLAGDAAGRGVRADGRAGLGAVWPKAEVVVDAFTLLATNGAPARWFEADCGTPVQFSRANAALDAGESGSATAVSDALAAWTGVAGASLVLGEGARTTTAPSIIGGTLDGTNTIQFDDPFGEVTDLVGCSGVLARGGFISILDTTFVGFSRTVGGQTFGRIVEGDVTVNPGVTACLHSGNGLAETLAHEVGHAIGFGHSSESVAESDPALRDALMYFQVHDDGRGASLRDDDRAGLLASYPSDVIPATAVGTFACHLDLGILPTACLDTSLLLRSFKRFDKARAAATAASRTTKRGKQRKQVRKSLALLKTTGKLINKDMTGACRDGMRAIVAARIAEGKAVLPTI